MDKLEVEKKKEVYDQEKYMKLLAE